MGATRPGLPVSLYVAGKKCVVVGSGEAADARVAMLKGAGARAEKVGVATADARALAGAWLVMVVDPAHADRVVPAAKASGALVYVQDAPDRSDMALPAVHRRGPLTVTVSTDGVAPALARHLRDELGRLIDDAGAAIDRLIADMRAARDAAPPGAARRDSLLTLARRLRVE